MAENKLRNRSVKKTTIDHIANVEKQRAAIKAKEPIVSLGINYDSSLNDFYNYHNQYSDDKTVVKWIKKYYVSERDGEAIKIFENAPDCELRSLGLLVRVLMRGGELEPRHYDRITYLYDKLEQKYAPAISSSNPKPTIQTNLINVADNLISEIDCAFDDFITDNKSFEIERFIAHNKISSPVANKIAEHFNVLLCELKEALSCKDPDLKEGYVDHFGKVKIKKMIAFVEAIINGCLQHKQNKKSERKPRAKKKKPANLLVAKMKHIKKWGKLESVDPKTIIGAKLVWLYDTAKRRLFSYYAVDSDGLTVKGTTILNFDVTKSGNKGIRNPDKFFSNINLSKKNMEKIYNSVKGVNKKNNGRTNDNVLILAAF